MPFINDELLNVQTDIIAYMLNKYHEAETERDKKWVSKLLKLACRELEKFIVPRASVEAQAKANSLKIGCLSRYKWLDQPRKMRDPGRKIFHFEHVMPVADMFAELIRLSDKSRESVKSVLFKADIAWILKSENEILDRSGYRSNRPKNPWLSYAECGIEIVGM